MERRCALRPSGSYVGVPVVNSDGKANLLPYDYHLVDAEDTASWTVTTTRSAQAYFLLGVDSLTNVSGAFGGASTIKGMYWAWNSGYINLKLKGAARIRPILRTHSNSIWVAAPPPMRQRSAWCCPSWNG